MYQGNVGSVARAMKNFGYNDLVLVNPCKLEGEARAMTNDVSSTEIATADLSNLNERELKGKVNELRSKIEKSERQLASIFKELKINRTDIDELKEKRDSLNHQVKERVAKAQELRDKRDDINKAIREYKGKRSDVNSKTQELFSGIAGLKEQRDEYNKCSHGSVESLTKAYEAELDAFLNKELPLAVEIKIFQKLNDLDKRLQAAKKANELHEHVKNRLGAHDLACRGDKRRISKLLSNPGHFIKYGIIFVKSVLFF